MDPSKVDVPPQANGTGSQESLSFLANIATSQQFNGLTFPGLSSNNHVSDINSVGTSSSVTVGGNLNNTKLSFTNATGIHSNQVATAIANDGENLSSLSTASQGNVVFASSIPVSSVSQNMAIIRGIPMVPYSQVGPSLHGPLASSTCSSITTLANKTKTDSHPYTSSLSLPSVVPSSSAHSASFHGVYPGQHIPVIPVAGTQNLILQQSQFGVPQNGMLHIPNPHATSRQLPLNGVQLQQQHQHQQQQQPSSVLLQHQALPPIQQHSLPQAMLIHQQPQSIHHQAQPMHQQPLLTIPQCSTSMSVWSNPPTSLQSSAVASGVSLACENSAIMSTSSVVSSTSTNVGSNSDSANSGFCLAPKPVANNTSDANQCSEVFNTIREALSVADNNTEVTTTTNIYPDDQPPYLNPASSSSNMSETSNNQLASFNSLTTSAYQLICRHCSFATDFHMVFTRHMACHFAEKGYECPLCVSVYLNEPELKQHVNVQHLQNRHNCETKSGIAKDASDLNVADGQVRLDNMDAHSVAGAFQVENGTPNSNEVSSYGDLMKWTPPANHCAPNVAKKQKVAKLRKKSNSKANCERKRKKSTKEQSYCTKVEKNSKDKKIKGKGKSNCKISSGHVNTSSSKKSSSLKTLGNGLKNSKKRQLEEENCDDEDDIYQPIDPIATTNKSLSYMDFYKRQSFMSPNVGTQNNMSNSISNSFLCHQTSGNHTSQAMSGANFASQDPGFRSPQCQGAPNPHALTPSNNNPAVDPHTSDGKLTNFCNYSIEQLSNRNPSTYLCNDLSGLYSYQSEPLPLIVNAKGNTSNNTGLPDTRNPCPANGNNSQEGQDFNSANSMFFSGLGVDESNVINNSGALINGNEKQNGSPSEHITVKIDPFDVAPSMNNDRGCGARVSQQQQVQQQQYPVSRQQQQDMYSMGQSDRLGASAGQMVPGTTNTGGLNTMCKSNMSNNHQTSMFDAPWNYNNLTNLEAAPSKPFSNSGPESASNPSPELRPASAHPDSTFHATKTQTSKYSVNFPISKKTGFFSTSKVSSAVKSTASKRRGGGRQKDNSYSKSTTVANRGRGSKHGGKYGAAGGSKHSVDSRGDPCTVDDIIDRTVGMGKTLRSCHDGNSEGPDCNTSSAAHNLCSEIPNNNNNNNEAFTCEADSSSIDDDSDKHEKTNPSVRLESGNESNLFVKEEVLSSTSFSGTQNFRDGTRSNSNNGGIAAHHTNDVKKEITCNDNRNSDVTSLSTKDSEIEQCADGIEKEASKTKVANSGVEERENGSKTAKEVTSNAVHVTSDVAKEAVNGDARSNIYLCRVCGFETHYELVFARHAPSHRKKNGVIK